MKQTVPLPFAKLQRVLLLLLVKAAGRTEKSQQWRRGLSALERQRPALPLPFRPHQCWRHLLLLLLLLPLRLLLLLLLLPPSRWRRWRRRWERRRGKRQRQTQAHHYRQGVALAGISP